MLSTDWCLRDLYSSFFKFYHVRTTFYIISASQNRQILITPFHKVHSVWQVLQNLKQQYNVQYSKTVSRKIPNCSFPTTNVSLAAVPEPEAQRQGAAPLQMWRAPAFSGPAREQQELNAGRSFPLGPLHLDCSGCRSSQAVQVTTPQRKAHLRDLS